VVLPAAAQAATSAQGAPHALPVPQAVGAPGWDREVGNQVAWLAHQTGGKAELVLTPPQMGRIEVSVSVTGDQANATFISANPVVREALESALPRLREVLAEAGIQLGQAQVGAENMRQSAQQEKNGDNPAADRAPGSIAAMQAAGHALPAAGLKIGRGLVDVFA
jgi:flagellar hook-length control protein FliK